MVLVAAATFVLARNATTFQKTIVDKRFVSEGIAVGDVDRDGKLDLIAGSAWYEAPTWKPHEIAPYVAIDTKTAWSASFHNWAVDLNADGWVDQIVIGMPGEKAIWRENPKGKDEPWKEHVIWRSACNESPLFEDLFSNGKRVLVMGYDDDRLAWFEPAQDPNKEWIPHDISKPKGAGSQRYSHGLGIGDIDGDGSNEVFTKSGYYDLKYGPEGFEWTFVNADFGADCAHMLSFDGGVLATSAHARGVWWYRPASSGFTKTTIDETISETHAACLVTFDGRTNLVTGKRKYAHPPGVDVGSEEPSWLVRYEYEDGKWTRHIIDEDSGVGTQFVVQDIDGDGKADIATANKNGVFLFTQRAKQKEEADQATSSFR